MTPAYARRARVSSTADGSAVTLAGMISSLKPRLLLCALLLAGCGGGGDGGRGGVGGSGPAGAGGGGGSATAGTGGGAGAANAGAGGSSTGGSSGGSGGSATAGTGGGAVGRGGDGGGAAGAAGAAGRGGTGGGAAGAAGRGGAGGTAGAAGGASGAGGEVVVYVSGSSSTISILALDLSTGALTSRGTARRWHQPDVPRVQPQQSFPLCRQRRPGAHHELPHRRGRRAHQPRRRLDRGHGRQHELHGVGDARVGPPHGQLGVRSALR